MDACCTQLLKSRDEQIERAAAEQQRVREGMWELCLPLLRVPEPRPGPPSPFPPSRSHTHFCPTTLPQVTV